MSISKTMMLIMEATCDHCGKKESQTFIEGVSAEGDVAFPNWAMFYLSVGINLQPPKPEKHVCSEACYIALCQKDYMTWEASRK